MTSATLESPVVRAAPTAPAAAVAAVPTPPVGTRRPYLAPVPECEPPYDDERSPLDRLRALTGRRSGVWPDSPTVPAVPTVPRALATTAGAARTRASSPAVPETVSSRLVPRWSKDPDVGVRPTGTGELPPALRTASMLARAVVEIETGRRPVAQLRTHCAPEVFAGFVDRPRHASARLPKLCSVRVCEAADGVAEASAVFRHDARVRAMAFRLEGVDGRWRITALQLG